MPEPKIAISAIGDKDHEFTVRHGLQAIENAPSSTACASQAHCRNKNHRRCNLRRTAAVDIEKTGDLVRDNFLGHKIFPIDRKQRIPTEGIFQIREKQFLMLLFVVDAEYDELTQIVRQRLPRLKSVAIARRRVF